MTFGRKTPTTKYGIVTSIFAAEGERWAAPSRILAQGALTLAIGLASTAPLDAALIRFKEAARPTSAVVRLADIAEIHAADPAETARLGGLTLTPAPAAGRTLRLDFDTIRHRLVSQGINLSLHEFSGASVVLVEADKVRVEGAKERVAPPPTDQAHRRAEELVERAAEAYLQEKSPENGHLAVTLTLPADQAALVHSAGAARLEISGGAAPWLGEQQLAVAFFDRQGKRRELSFGCRVAPLPKILVVKLSVPRGHVLRAEDLAWKQLESTDSADQYLDRVELAVGQETRKALRAGERLSTEDLRAVPLIRRGDIVTVSSRVAGITVRMEAKAQSDGCLGQTVKLQSLDGRRELNGTVTGFHEAAATSAPAQEAGQFSVGTGVRLLSSDSNRVADGAPSRSATAPRGQ